MNNLNKLVKPLIWQEREPTFFRAMTHNDNINVFAYVRLYKESSSKVGTATVKFVVGGDELKIYNREGFDTLKEAQEYIQDVHVNYVLDIIEKHLVVGEIVALHRKNIIEQI